MQGCLCGVGETTNAGDSLTDAAAPGSPPGCTGRHRAPPRGTHTHSERGPGRQAVGHATPCPASDTPPRFLPLAARIRNTVCLTEAVMCKGLMETTLSHYFVINHPKTAPQQPQACHLPRMAGGEDKGATHTCLGCDDGRGSPLPRRGTEAGAQRGAGCLGTERRGGGPRFPNYWHQKPSHKSYQIFVIKTIIIFNAKFNTLYILFLI